MTKPPAPDEQGSSTRPYLIRALHDWCTDNGFTPYLAVYVSAGVQVPMEYVKNNEIVLNVGFEATSGLSLGNEFIEFKARFGGVSREILVPVEHVVAIYARENGQGMAFPVPTDSSTDALVPAVDNVRPGPGGLRLATPASSGEDERPVVRPVSPAADMPPEDPPQPPAPGPAGRPSLKRVK